MPLARATNAHLTVNACPGEAKTLLAFDLATPGAHERLAGFTIEVLAPGCRYFVDNNLRLAPSAAHAQLTSESPFASVNAPIQKFRWVHVPGLVHQAGQPSFGTYTYVVTPRYFSEQGALQPLDPSTSVAVDVDVRPFAAGEVKLGFTRGYLQSQAFVRRFGSAIAIRPPSDELLYDTSAVAGENAYGDSFSYADVYEWLGSTARQRVFELLDDVRDDPSLTLDVLVHDLDEPDVCAALLALGSAGRVRIVLAESADHDDTGEPTPEDLFEAVFAARAGDWAIRRVAFGRGSRDDVLVVSDADGPRTVLTGSAPCSVAGLYVHADHVLVVDDRTLATARAEAFERTWTTGRDDAHVVESHCSAALPSENKASRKHASRASTCSARPAQGAGRDDELHEALHAAHSDSAVFSAGTPGSVALYTPGRSRGFRRPATSLLPAPFSQVPRRPGLGLHHEFVVLGFGGPDPVVCRGASHTAPGSEQVLRRVDVATAFAIEALLLVEHHKFLDRLEHWVGPAATPGRPADRRTAAVAVGWFLATTDTWATKYYDPRYPHHADRELFGCNGFATAELRDVG